MSENEDSDIFMTSLDAPSSGKQTTLFGKPAKVQPSKEKEAKKDHNANLPWVEKYRPSELDELISHQDIINTINNLVSSNKLPHLLFYGPPGTGKTSTVLALARKLNGPNFRNQVLELNASDDRGIDVVREQIKDFASSRQLFSRGVKLIILDEADSMTSTAQFALRRVIEKYASNTRFCLICNYINKIIPALQSRCTRFRFGPLPTEQITHRLKTIAVTEGVKLTDEGLTAIIKLAEGDMRKCLNVMQACHLAYPEVTEEAVYACTGNPLPSDIAAIVRIMLNHDFNDAFQGVAKIQSEKGLSLTDIVSYVHEFCQRLSLPPHTITYVYDKLSDIEYRLSFGTNEKLQLGALIGTFQTARQQIPAASD